MNNKMPRYIKVINLHVQNGYNDSIKAIYQNHVMFHRNRNIHQLKMDRNGKRNYLSFHTDETLELIESCSHIHSPAYQRFLRRKE